MPEQAEIGYLTADADVRALRDEAQCLPETQAADHFNELQPEHSERLAAEQQMLERRRTDLNALIVRQVLVPALELTGTAALGPREEDLRQ